MVDIVEEESEVRGGASAIRPERGGGAESIFCKLSYYFDMKMKEMKESVWIAGVKVEKTKEMTIQKGKGSEKLLLD